MNLPNIKLEYFTLGLIALIMCAALEFKLNLFPGVLDDLSVLTFESVGWIVLIFAISYPLGLIIENIAAMTFNPYGEMVHNSNNWGDNKNLDDILLYRLGEGGGRALVPSINHHKSTFRILRSISMLFMLFAIAAGIFNVTTAQGVAFSVFMSVLAFVAFHNSVNAYSHRVRVLYDVTQGKKEVVKNRAKSEPNGKVK